MFVEHKTPWPYPDSVSEWFAAMSRTGLAQALAAHKFHVWAATLPCTSPRRPCRARRLHGSLAVYSAFAPAPRGPEPVAENFYVVENFHEYGPLAYKDVAGRWVHL